MQEKKLDNILAVKSAQSGFSTYNTPIRTFSQEGAFFML
jgi:hypothetical protein